MNIWVRKGRSFDEEAKADREFWRQTTAIERLKALEELRLEAWGAEGSAEGLRRVARIVGEEDLIHNKKLVARPQDLADVAVLEFYRAEES
jgi:hypothetical protein